MSQTLISETPVAIVTGASAGIGAACARELSRRGYRLAIMSRSNCIDEVARELGAVAVRGTVSSASDLERLVASAVQAFGRVDAVVNGSGHPATADLLEITDELWSEVFETYLLSVVRMSRLVVPHLARNGGGAIVNISGSDVYEPDPRWTAAGVLRAGVTSYTKLFARRFAAQHIRMNCVAPNVVLEPSQEGVREDLRQELPIQRAASPAEVAKVVAFLLSQEASYISGETVRVDAGASRAV